MRALKREERWIVLGIPVLFLAGCLFHFLYDITGRFAVIAAIAPVNESVWEHEKLMVVPIILWWVIYYVVSPRMGRRNIRKWMAATVVALIGALLLMPMIYYFYTEALEFNSVIIDIIILLICLVWAQLLGLHIYQHGRGIPVWISILILCSIIFGMILATFYPPHIAIFRDSLSGGYGIL
ncbi:MAG: DUF6512 family protein [bacterium]|nr:DUF6512 family protein [bacterium]